jgi:predicted nucleotide-binding protein
VRTEYDFNAVKYFVYHDISDQSEATLINACKTADGSISDIKTLFETLLDVLIEDKTTAFFRTMKDEIHKIKIHVPQEDFAKVLHPRSQYRSHDSIALSQGIQVPPHIQIQTWLMSLLSPYHATEEVLILAKKSLNYMKLNDILEKGDNMSGNKIFIGHGRSPLWRELKDFIKDRLQLPWEEFNREPVAGKTTIERLSEMLDNSIFAFLIMTGEDEHADNSVHARENVIHEVGLFQGKLGFRKAIVLLEEGCGEFSNITGLSQIRFPKGNISAKLEDIRQVLEREGILK